MGMNFDEARCKSDLLHLATRIKAHLKPCSRMWIEEPGETARLIGVLNLSHDEIKTSICARCSFRLVVDWVNNLPVVRADEPWFKREGAEWHAFRDGSLCYVYAPHWREEIGAVMAEFDIGQAAAFAASWCIRSTRWLLYRHHFAFEYGIKKWPAEWPFWPHDHKAQMEYEKFKRTAQRLSNGTRRIQSEAR
jgi:hypothetical protein